MRGKILVCPFAAAEKAEEDAFCRENFLVRALSFHRLPQNIVRQIWYNDDEL